MNREILLVLGARPAQLPVLRKARELGLRVVAADPHVHPAAREWIHAGIELDLAEIGALTALAQQHNVGGVLTFAADYPVPAWAALCEALHLPGPTRDCALRCTHKAAMRECLEGAGVPVPRWFFAVNPQAAVQARRELAGDVVVKPSLSQGGRGIARVAADESDDAFVRAWQRACDHSRAEGALVEACIDGPEFSIETLSFDGQVHVVAVTDKLTLGPPHFVEIGHQQPTRLPRSDALRVCDAAVAAVRALGIVHGAAHVELRWAASGPVLMEVGARAGGGYIVSHLVELSTGFDMVRACIELAMGRTPVIPDQPLAQPAAVRFASAPPGTVVSLHGLHEALAMPGVADAAFEVELGQVLLPLEDSRGRSAHVVARGDSLDAAARNAEAALARLVVRTQAG